MIEFDLSKCSVVVEKVVVWVKADGSVIDLDSCLKVLSAEANIAVVSKKDLVFRVEVYCSFVIFLSFRQLRKRKIGISSIIVVAGKGSVIKSFGIL